MAGVYNRRYQELLLQNKFDNCRRHQCDVTLLITDIDYFKNISDIQGHDVGDQAIVTLIRQLQVTLRGSDVTDRFGGDESAVIMCGTPASSAIATMSRVHERLTQLRLFCMSQIDPRISMGIALLTFEAEHYREWLGSVDMALYEVGNPGRNRTEAAA